MPKVTLHATGRMGRVAAGGVMGSRVQDAEADLSARTARAIDRLGTGAFYDALLDILGSAAPHDLAALCAIRGRRRPI